MLRHTLKRSQIALTRPFAHDVSSLMSAVIELHALLTETRHDARSKQAAAKASHRPAHSSVINKSFYEKARKYWLLET
jgi:hypothetical protein